ncbi:MAG: DUF6325 family protein [Candidatus Saccharimonadales bacterium]
MLGPVDYVAIGFPQNNFKGEIIAELQKLVDSGLVRIIDLVFVTKDAAGNAAIVELENMPPEVAAAFKAYANDLTGLMTEEDALELADSLDNNSSAGVLVFEHLWAKSFKEAVLKADGVLLAEGRVHPDAVSAAEAEVEAKKEGEK